MVLFAAQSDVAWRRGEKRVRVNVKPDPMMRNARMCRDQHGEQIALSSGGMALGATYAIKWHVTAVASMAETIGMKGSAYR